MDGVDSAESRLQGDFIKFKQSLGKGDIEGSMLESVSILERSRSKEERDPVIEALVRGDGGAVTGVGQRPHTTRSREPFLMPRAFSCISVRLRFVFWFKRHTSVARRRDAPVRRGARRPGRRPRPAW